MGVTYQDVVDKRNETQRLYAKAGEIKRQAAEVRKEMMEMWEKLEEQGQTLYGRGKQ